MKPADQARWEALQSELFAVRAEMDEIKSHYDTDEARAQIGRFYKYRNCYSMPETDADHWWLYLSVISQDEGVLNTFTFQVDKNGRIEIEERPKYHGMSLRGYVEIDRAEFEAAWRAVGNKIAGMRRFA